MDIVKFIFITGLSFNKKKEIIYNKKKKKKKKKKKNNKIKVKNIIII